MDAPVHMYICIYYPESVTNELTDWLNEPKSKDEATLQSSFSPNLSGPLTKNHSVSSQLLYLNDEQYPLHSTTVLQLFPHSLCFKK